MRGGRVVHVLSDQPYDLYIGCAMTRYGLKESFFANPYKVGQDGDLDEVLATYEDRDGDLDEVLATYEEHARRLFRMYPSALVNLQSMFRRGVVLGCWCPSKSGGWLTLEDPEVCHGQTLLRLVAYASNSDDKRLHQRSS